MNTRQINYQSYGARPYVSLQSRLSWGAIFAGSFVAVATFFSLAILGAGFGMAAVPVTDSVAVGYGAAAFALVCALAAYFCGGWIAGRLSPMGHVADSVLHGVVCWAFTVVFSGLLIASTAGAAFGGLRGLIGSAPGLGIVGGFAMIVELAVCCLGARLGTRVYRYVSPESFEARLPEREFSERELTEV